MREGWMHETKTVAVIGLGYIGLPTAAILATNGVHVIGVDVNPVHVDAVNRGEEPESAPAGNRKGKVREPDNKESAPPSAAV